VQASFATYNPGFCTFSVEDCTFGVEFSTNKAPKVQVPPLYRSFTRRIFPHIFHWDFVEIVVEKYAENASSEATVAGSVPAPGFFPTECSHQPLY
jgi:hypothetical protein